MKPTTNQPTQENPMDEREQPAMPEKSNYQRYQEAWAVLSPTQRARVMLKQQWEHCSRLAIFADWPSLFDPDREQDESELEGCRALIAERPGLFPGVTVDA